MEVENIAEPDAWQIQLAETQPCFVVWFLAFTGITACFHS